MTSVVWDAVVIGTGPSAHATVTALIARGVRPLVIESSQEELGGTFAARDGMAASVGFKTWNGSDAMYRPHPRSPIRYDPRLTVRAANYLGGLSRVWGATHEPYREFRRWPQECIPAEVDWSAVFGSVPRTTTGQCAPADGPKLRVLPMEGRLTVVKRRSSARDPYVLQPSHLAIETRLEAENVCDASGTCLQGCSQESIWWAGGSFCTWAQDGTIDLIRGEFVESLEESRGGGSVLLHLVDTSGERREVECRRAFVAAGAIGTGAILITSGYVDRLTIHDSQTAFGAMVSIRNPRKGQPPSHSLSHLWAREREATEFLAQLYPPDPSHADRVTAKVPALPTVALEALVGRLYPFISYLDSDRSGTLLLRRSGSEFVVEPGREGDRRVMMGHLRHLARQVLKAGFLLPYFATDFAPQGGGFHFGASLAHGSVSDAWGRPFGLKRVHVVDASVLPHIEAGSITPTVMANAHRIARTVPWEVD